MKAIRFGVRIGLLMALGAMGAFGQQSPSAEPATPAGGTSATDTAPPRLVKFTGTLKDTSGKLLHGTVSASFALYENQDDTVPLWQEIQELQTDQQGRYSVLLGATQSGGLPLDLFAAQQARWLGVQATGQAEGPRVLLVNVPYALRAEEAEQLGGKPASDYVLASDLLDTLGHEVESGARLPGPAAGTAGKGAGTGSRSVADPSSKSQCLVLDGTKLVVRGCNTATGTGWPSSWAVNTGTNAVTAQPLAGQNAVPLTLAPNVANPTADLFDVYEDPGLTMQVFSINAQGFVTFQGNNVIFGRTKQAAQSYLRLYGSTANSNLAPPYLDLEKTDTSVKTFLAASTTSNGAICLSSTAPTGDCPTSGTIIKTTAFVLPGGPAWTSGTGAPTGHCITGSLYSRADGGVGSTLYVCQSGAWAPK